MNKEESNEKLWAQLMEKRDAQLSEFQGTLDGKRKLNQTVRKMIKLKPKLSDDFRIAMQDARDHYFPIVLLCNTNELKIDFFDENFIPFIEELDHEWGEILSDCIESFEEDEGLSADEKEEVNLMFDDWYHNRAPNCQIKKKGNDLFGRFKIYAFDYFILGHITRFIDPSYMENEEYERRLRQLNNMITNLSPLIRKHLI
tara:strand:- start:208 stop:807 length:600 start_codon:yes stop_codon:yes gene_type:complete